MIYILIFIKKDKPKIFNLKYQRLIIREPLNPKFTIREKTS